MSSPASPVYLVDGSNVARSDAWAEVMRRERAEFPHESWDDRPDPRSRLADWLLHWRTSSGADVVLVFDGEGPRGAGRHQWDHGFLVIGSGSTSGDGVVEAEASRLHRERRAFRVVTSDRTLGDVAGAHAEAVLDVPAFVAELTETSVEHGSSRQLENDVERSSSPTQLGDTVDAATLARLERMRRGLDT